MPRKIFLLLLSLILVLSCSKRESYVSETLFLDLHRADSLIKCGQLSVAEPLLDSILSYPLAVRKETLGSSIVRLFDKSSKATAEDPYFDYLFTYLAQLEAIDLKERLYDDEEERVSIEKLMFKLAPELDDVAELLSRRLLASKQSFYASLFRLSDAYYNYSKATDNFVPFIRRNSLIPFIYECKWNRICRLLQRSDALYGYEETFSFFDRILQIHGASPAEYLKTLLKIYMSFSGKPQYRCDINLSYEEFKQLFASTEDWIVSELDGIIIDDGVNSLCSPSMLTVYFGKDYTVISKDNTILTRTKRLLDRPRSAIINKALVKAILLSHGINTQSLDICVQSFERDTIFRKGPEKDLFSEVKYVYSHGLYLDSMLLVESALFNNDGSVERDSLGIHRRRWIYSGGHIVEKRFEAGPSIKLPRGQIAHIKYYDDNGCSITSSYDDYDNLILNEKSSEGGKVKEAFDGLGRIVYHENGSQESNYDYTDTTVVITTRDNEANAAFKVINHTLYTKEYPYSHVAKEVYVFNDTWATDVIEKQLFFANDIPYYGDEGWALEKYLLDDKSGRRMFTSCYDGEGNLQGGYQYEYCEGYIEEIKLDKDGKQLSVNRLYEDRINRFPWL